MMVIIPKWQVEVATLSGASIIFYISDNHLSNVLRKVSDIEFEGDPQAIIITLLPRVIQ